MIESIHIATIVQDPLASPSKDVGQQDYKKNENSLNDTPPIDISINDDCSSEVSWSSCDEEKLKKCEKPPPPRYNPVNLHLSNENDLRRLKKCLCHFFGRLPIKKIWFNFFTCSTLVYLCQILNLLLQKLKDDFNAFICCNCPTFINIGRYCCWLFTFLFFCY